MSEMDEILRAVADARRDADRDGEVFHPLRLATAVSVVYPDIDGEDVQRIVDEYRRLSRLEADRASR